jgi:hypothetical protein
MSNLVALSLVAFVLSACGYFEDWGGSEEPSSAVSDTTPSETTTSYTKMSYGSDGHRASGHHSHHSHHSEYNGGEHSHGRRH